MMFLDGLLTSSCDNSTTLYLIPFIISPPETEIGASWRLVLMPGRIALIYVNLLCRLPLLLCEFLFVHIRTSAVKGERL